MHDAHRLPRLGRVAAGTGITCFGEIYQQPVGVFGFQRGVERQEILGKPRHLSGSASTAGGLQTAQKIVTQVQRFGDGLEPDRVVGEAGDVEQSGDAAGGQQQPVVAPAPPHQSAASLRCPAMRRVSRDRRTRPIG